MCHREETITNDDRGGGGGGLVRSNFKRKSKAKGRKCAHIFF